jgi:hypothetical protein
VGNTSEFQNDGKGDEVGGYFRQRDGIDAIDSDDVTMNQPAPAPRGVTVPVFHAPGNNPGGQVFGGNASQAFVNERRDGSLTQRPDEMPPRPTGNVEDRVYGAAGPRDLPAASADWGMAGTPPPPLRVSEMSPGRAGHSPIAGGAPLSSAVKLANSRVGAREIPQTVATALQSAEPTGTKAAPSGGPWTHRRSRGRS